MQISDKISEPEEKVVLQKAIDIFYTLVDSYASSILKNTQIEEALQKKESVIKCVALLGGFAFRGLRRDLNAWEISLNKLDKEFKNVKNLKIVKELMSGIIATGERVILEAQKMKQFDLKVFELLQVKNAAMNQNSRNQKRKIVLDLDYLSSVQESGYQGCLLNDKNDLKTGLESLQHIRTQFRQMQLNMLTEKQIQNLISNYRAQNSILDIDDTLTYFQNILHNLALSKIIIQKMEEFE